MPHYLQQFFRIKLLPKLLISLLLTASIPSNGSETTTQATITLGNVNYCPYACGVEEASEHPGYMVELATEVGDLVGIDIKRIIAPFSRIQKIATNGRIAGFFLYGDTQDLTHFLKTDISVLLQPCFFVNHDDPWNYQNEGSLEMRQLGLVQGYGYPMMINNFVERKKNDPLRPQFISSEKPQTQNIRKLVGDRVDTLYDTLMVINWTAEQIGLSDRIRPAGCPSKQILRANTVISKNYPNAELLVKEINRGYRLIKQTGRIEALKKKYNIIEP